MSRPDVLPAGSGFLGLPDEKDCAYESSSVVMQQLPYEYTSSYISGSKIGPARIVETSPFLEFYDEETGLESCFLTGICTLESTDFSAIVDEAAVQRIYDQTRQLIEDGKFVISLGAEHTVTYGLFKAHAKTYPGLGILQLDAHSDLRMSYENNIWSHACVMARIHELNQPPIIQVGIRAQCKEEAELMKRSANIHTFYAHEVAGRLEQHIESILERLPEYVYITIDADGFDPSIIPAVGTAEPGGLLWYESLQLLKAVCTQKKVVGIDVVEIAPKANEIISEFSLARLTYKLHSYLCTNPWYLSKFGRYD